MAEVTGRAKLGDVLKIRPTSSPRMRLGRAGFACILTAMLGPVACASTPPPSSKPTTEPEKVVVTTPATSAAVAPPALPPLREPPVPTRREDVVETLHGQTISDPYRWLENGESKEVIEWTAAQNAVTRKALDALQGRQALASRIEALLRIGSAGTPFVVGTAKKKPRYFFTRQAPSENQPALYVRVGDKGQDKKILDPNTMSTDGTVSLDAWYPSNDGKLLAYATSSGGNELSTLHVMDVDTGKDLPDTEVIPGARYVSVGWLPDGKSFYYTRFPQKGEVPAGEENYHRKIFLHTIGKPWKQDPLVFGEGRKMTDSPSVDISPNGRWLFVTVGQGWSRTEVFMLDRQGKDAKFVPFAVPKEDAIFDVNVYDDFLLVRTNDGAPRYELYVVDPKKPARENWKKVIAQSDNVLESATAIGGKIFATFNHDAHSLVKQFSMEGKLDAEIKLPTIGTTGRVSGEWEGKEAFIGFTSFTVPTTILRLDLKTSKTETWADVQAPIDRTKFVVLQEKAKSKDGTMIPYFLIHRRDIGRDGKAPTLLTGYGGFNISQTPAFAGSRYVMLEQGGVIVVTNLRGGGEFGEAWHRAGMLENKQNVFDDFIAVAEKLIADKVTSPDKLGILGGSNGGLLIGAAITQRPDLFRAAVSAVPLLDMLRYHHFLIAKLWIPEYGSADDPKQFEWLRAYSPYHHVKPGTAYPAVLFATAEGDSRVDPLHARKMAARMQAEGGGDRPVLVRIESKAGHGAGKPVSKRVDEATDIFSFLFWQLGIEPPK